MLEVAGLWELGWTTPITDHDSWAFMLREFEVDTWHMAPVSGIVKGAGTALIEHNDLSWLVGVAQQEPGRVVFVDEKGKTDLADFVHPTDALYVLGRSGTSTFDLYAGPDDLSLSITTPRGTAGLWAHQAITLVLYDRMVKHGSNPH